MSNCVWSLVLGASLELGCWCLELCLHFHDIRASLSCDCLLAMAERPVKQKNRKPSFFWQGVLILAPVLVLAKLGALAISQDKRMARQAAELQAQEMADDAATNIWN